MLGKLTCHQIKYINGIFIKTANMINESNHILGQLSSWGRLLIIKVNHVKTKLKDCDVQNSSKFINQIIKHKIKTTIHYTYEGKKSFYEANTQSTTNKKLKSFAF